MSGADPKLVITDIVKDRMAIAALGITLSFNNKKYCVMVFLTLLFKKIYFFNEHKIKLTSSAYSSISFKTCKYHHNQYTEEFYHLPAPKLPPVIPLSHLPFIPNFWKPL